jgi:cytochrome P450
MARLFGLPDADALGLVDLATELTKVFDRGRSLTFYAAMNAKAAAARAVLLDAVRARRRQPGPDALSRMLAINDAEFGLEEGDIATRAFFLFLAGVETTSALIGGALRALLMHPAEMARLAAGAIAPAEAFEELTRWTSPVQQASRYATEDVEVAGHAIRAGQRVVLLLGAANRDPDSYAEPDRLVLGRAGPPSLTFGAGLHHCIGLGLARLETTIAIAQVLALPPLRPIGPEAEWLAHRTQRRLRRLPAEFA